MGELGKLVLATVAVFVFTINSQSATHRLDFAGQNASANYSGYFLYDFSVAIDDNPSSTQGQFDGIIVAAYLQVNGLEFVNSESSFDSSIVENDSLVAGDYFASAVAMVNPFTGVQEGVAVQFRLLAGTLWGSDALPTHFELADFDPYDPAVTNDLGTGILLPASLFDTPAGFVSLDSASLYAVPLPAGLVLMLSALATLTTGVSRSRIK